LDGSVEVGRYEHEIGAHAIGYNAQSIGICVIGTDDFTHPQIHSLLNLIRDIQERHGIPDENVLGHYETSQAGGKTCPNMDMETLRRQL
jgi:N-acetyl-anhydromuramyl-L-alanine amidase AmpD